MKSILSSTTWHQYETGHISQGDCYRLIGNQFSIDPQEVGLAFQQARDSLQPNVDFIHFIRALKAESHGTLRVFAMSNISQPDYAVLRTKDADWAVFDDIFTSADAGVRKPHLGFYKLVLGKIGADPNDTVFVDDKGDNVLSARSLGLHGIVFDSMDNVKRALRYLISDPIRRGREFLQARAGHLESETNTGIEIGDNFAQLLILEATKDRTLVNYMDHPNKWNFFRDQPLLTTEDFPFDLDTTSIGTLATRRDDGTANLVMDEMLQYRDEDGIIQTYFDHERPRIDPIVCVNVLSLFYSRGRGSELAPTLEWVRGVLKHRAYLDGTRYYETGECFLFFLSRLLQSTKDAALHASLKSLFAERVKERIGAPGDALALAMRILACAAMGMRNEIDLRSLLPLQCEDGGWEAGWVYKYGSSGVKIGNRGLTTALALNAIEAVEGRRARPKSGKISRVSRHSEVAAAPRSPTSSHRSNRSISKTFQAYFKASWTSMKQVAVA